MRLLAVIVSVAMGAGAAVWAQTQRTTPEPKTAPATAPASHAVDKGARWLASVQGADGGWGQDGGEVSSVRSAERLESSGNDVANTAVAALALLQAGTQYKPHVERALAFVLQRIEASPADGLAITDRQGTQIQRKLGPYIDTFLSSMLMSQIDGRASTPALNARVRKALQKTVAKIEKHQQSDGSWNTAGGWAPVLGTSMASRSLFEAQSRGVAVDAEVLKRAETYTVSALSATAAARGSSRARGGRWQIDRCLDRSTRRSRRRPALSECTGAGAVEPHRGRPSAERREIGAIQSRLADTAFVSGFGSMGGEEFFSYLNISDSMKRVGGDAWSKWHADITQKILGLQNSDGSWAGHHCITGRVAMTSAAILNLTVDRAR